MKKLVKLMTMFILVVGLFACNSTGNSDIVIDPTNVGDDSTVITFSIDNRILNLPENYDKLNDSYKKFVDESGYIVKDLKVELKSEASVLDVLEAVTEEKGIAVSYGDMGTMKYVISINHIDAAILGGYSGWMVRVNGEFPPVGMEEIILKDGDVVDILFTTDMGEDIKKLD